MIPASNPSYCTSEPVLRVNGKVYYVVQALIPPTKTGAVIRRHLLHPAAHRQEPETRQPLLTCLRLSPV